ncbi:hypothetical protein RF11_06099 [Thelohanellus kitauei]|uniref:JAB1/MPN/MOV34 metalloenzyme domain-containing protein n=1 Tax=Thelohanellus kitauei TaxID=669202 RepID=A0A0C2IJK9_THEKT|nr:hypothetical protein RF11_06099 [Thelohanellus kitauei]
MLEKTKELLRSINTECEKLTIESSIPISRLFVGRLRFHDQYQSINQKQKIKVIERNLSLLEKVKVKLIEILDQAYQDEESAPEENLFENTLFEDKPLILSIEPRKIGVEPIKLNDPISINKSITPPVTENSHLYSSLERIQPQPDLLSEVDEVLSSPLPSCDRRLKPKMPLVDPTEWHPLADSLHYIPLYKSSDKFPPNLPKRLSDQNSETNSNTYPFNNNNQQISHQRVNRKLKPQPSQGSELIKLAPSSHKPHFDRSKKLSIEGTVIPGNLFESFVKIAQNNSRINRETCGILSGSKVCEIHSKLKNRYIVTHLIVPKQVGTDDSCECLNEEEIIYYQDSASLTHPSQTCFLSSVDLHTQYGYQCLPLQPLFRLSSTKSFNEFVEETKVDRERLIFNKDWMFKYFVAEVEKKTATDLDRKLVNQKDFLRKNKMPQKETIRASFVVAYNIARQAHRSVTIKSVHNTEKCLETVFREEL